MVTRKLPETTRLVKVHDTTGKKRKGHEYNICVRVDRASSESLSTLLGERESRSHFIGKVLTEFLDAMPDMDWKAVHAAGKQKERHPDEKTSQWQCQYASGGLR